MIIQALKIYIKKIKLATNWLQRTEEVWRVGDVRFYLFTLLRAFESISTRRTRNVLNCGEEQKYGQGKEEKLKKPTKK